MGKAAITGGVRPKISEVLRSSRHSRHKDKEITPSITGGETEVWREKALNNLPQKDELCNCFKLKGNAGETSRTRDEAYMGFPEDIDAILNCAEQ